MIIKIHGKLYIIAHELYAIMEKYENMPNDLKERIVAHQRENDGSIAEISNEDDISFLESISTPIKLDMASGEAPIQVPIICDLDTSDDPIQVLMLLDALADRQLINLFPSYLTEAERADLRAQKCNHLIPEMIAFYQLPADNKTFKSLYRKYIL